MGHLLLALIEERDPGVEARLAERGSDPAELLADVRKALGTGDDRLWDGILITPRVRNVVAIAERTVPEPSKIEPAHLFDALAQEGVGLAAELLHR